MYIHILLFPCIGFCCLSNLSTQYVMHKSIQYEIQSFRFNDLFRAGSGNRLTVGHWTFSDKAYWSFWVIFSYHFLCLTAFLVWLWLWIILEFFDHSLKKLFESLFFSPSLGHWKQPDTVSLWCLASPIMLFILFCDFCLENHGMEKEGLFSFDGPNCYGLFIFPLDVDMQS